MQAADAFWHITNFFAPALFLGRGLRLWAWASGASALAAVAGLVVFGQDGRMATYAAMVVACAVGLWWAGFRGGGKR